MKSIFNISKTLVFLSLFLLSCKSERSYKQTPSKYFILVVVDGARYSETWGEPTKQYIPYQNNELASQGVVYTNFYNKGYTYTTVGQVAMLTGLYEHIDNDGTAWPKLPSIFQYWNFDYNNSPKSFIICSKDKLEILAHCEDQNSMNFYSPIVDAGVNGLGSGYRHDSITFRHAKEAITSNHPNLLLISFREPDYSAHLEDWGAYLDGIKNTDKYIYYLWQFIQNDSIYKDNTTMMVTNDHGRHFDNVADGFVSHGDTCAGCRHISFFACGPNIKQGQIISTERELIDIPATIAWIMDIESYSGNGRVMTELFNDK